MFKMKRNEISDKPESKRTQTIDIKQDKQKINFQL